MRRGRVVAVGTTLYTEDLRERLAECVDSETAEEIERALNNQGGLE